MRDGFLLDPLLSATGVAHGFGLRASPSIPDVRRPEQVHGAHIVRLSVREVGELGEADGIVSDRPGVPVAVVTADCVPVLLASRSGRCVAAIHAGWRGLAAGVVSAGVRALGQLTDGEPLQAAIGPHIGCCCYEVDGPVVRALRARFGASLEEALFPARSLHWRLALSRLVRCDLLRAGVDPAAISLRWAACTCCAADRFHSFRRDGESAGRLLHWVAARE